jgi:phosphatidylserine decarboxylase
MDPFVVTSLGRKVLRTKCIRHNLNPVYNEKMVFQVMKHETNYSLSFSVIDRDKLSGNDFVASTSFPIQKMIQAAPEEDPATGLFKIYEQTEYSPPQPETSKKRFRLPLSRTSSASSLKNLGRTGLKRDDSQLSLVGLPLPPSDGQLTPGLMTPGLTTPSTQPASYLHLPTSAPAEDGMSRQTTATSENGHGQGEDPDMIPYTIPLEMKNKEKWEAKHSPQLFIRAKYLPYTALRQQFWRALLRQYDTDDSGRVSKIELTTMLDTLGSTLHESTIDGFFDRYAPENYATDTMDLTFDQAVICLEEQLQASSVKRTFGEKVKGLGLTPHGNRSHIDNNDTKHNTKAENSMRPSTNEKSTRSAIPTISQDDTGTAGEEGKLLDADDLAEEGGEEHVIEIRECPICHQPKLNKRTDADIITHIATCASSDWRQVNNLVMGGFVTASQAQRKWYSKVITKISYGGYKLGANSANILVQDRLTGQINEERMSVYVRLGIRLLYKALGSREMEKKRIKKMLRSLSMKQGKKYDDPASASQIQGFVNFHRLDMSEVLRPTEDFKNFNDFFYRQLKPDARPCSAPDDTKIIVSPADSRSVVFNTMDDATRIWVKGRDYSVEKLFGDAYPLEAKRYKGGSLGIFRLAPQDYHRFHIPVDGVLGTPKEIPGEYYTVNPMAIRSALDVYGDNIRVCVPIDSVSHGRVMFVCIGAMMVGSTVITRKAGEKVKRAEELGYFKFGGSTVLLLFEPGVMVYDDDLVANSKGALETLVSYCAMLWRSTSCFEKGLLTKIFPGPRRHVDWPSPKRGELQAGYEEG